MCLAVPGRVTGIEERDATRMAQVDFGGIAKEVCLEYLPDAAVGDYVVVHVGFAIQRLDEQSALDTLALFDNLGILEEEFGATVHRRRPAGRPRPASTDASAADRVRGGRVVKYLDEFSNPEHAKRLLDQIHRMTKGPWRIMEVCGGQTHSIIRNGIDQLLPQAVETHPRPGLSRLRDAAGDDRQGARHRRHAGRHVLLVRRHAARAGQPAGPAPP